MKKATFFFAILITAQFAFGQSAMTVTGNIGSNVNGMEFKHSNLSQGIGIGFNTLYAAGSNPTQDLGLSAKGSTGTLLFSTNGLERMRITGEGRMGIGTSNPSYPLHVLTGDGFGIMHQNGGIFLGTLTNSISGGSFGTFNAYPLHLFADYQINQMVLIPSGNVGIGLDNPLQKLHVAGSLAVDNNVGIGTATPTYKLQVKTVGNSYGISHTNGTVDIATYVETPVGAIGTKSNHQFQLYANDGINQFILMPSGRVGIGTANPLATLEIARGTSPNGSLWVNGTTYASHFSYNPSEDTYLRGGKPGAKVIINEYGDLGNVGIGTGNPLQKLHVGGKLAVDNNVGIGNSDPHAPLQFSQAEENRKIVLYENNNNEHEFFGFGVNSLTLRYQVPATNFNHIFYTGTSANTSSELMRIKGNGNVGIGVTEPNAMLEIARGTVETAPTGSLQVNGTTYASHFNYGTPEDTYIRGGKAGANVLINDYGEHGNVGIGTGSPTEKLDVNGNVDISGTLEIGYVRVFGPVVNVITMSYGSSTCNCPSGLVAIGGGFLVNDDSSEVIRSYANTDSSWYVEMFNSDFTWQTVQAFAICARLAN